MELNNFTINDLLNIDLQSNEVKKYLEALDLYGVNFATLEPVETSIVENFIKNYPPENHRSAYYNAISVVTFGLLFFNKEKILDSVIDAADIEKLLLEKTNFYHGFLGAIFKPEFKIAMDVSDPIEFAINHNSKLFLTIKKEYDILKHKDNLNESLAIKDISKPKSHKL